MSARIACRSGAITSCRTFFSWSWTPTPAIASDLVRRVNVPIRIHPTEERPFRPAFASIVDPDIDPADLGDQLGPERIDLAREPDIEAVDLLVQSVDFHCESSVDPIHLPIKGVDLLIQHTDVGPHRVHVASDRVELRSDEVLERLLDLVVDTHAWHFHQTPVGASTSRSGYTLDRGSVRDGR